MTEDMITNLLEDDPAFKKLLEEIKLVSKTSWPSEPYSIDRFRMAVLQYSKMTLGEFMATYKCNTMFGIFIGKILDKIHGVADDDIEAAMLISATKKAIIHYDAKPYFYVNRDADIPTTYTTVPLSIIRSEAKVGESPVVHGEITFSLVNPVIKLDTAHIGWKADFLNSVMTIGIPVSPTGKYEHRLLVKDFKPDMLKHIINDSKLGDF